MKISHRRQWIAAAAVTMALVGTAGCASNTPQPESEQSAPEPTAPEQWHHDEIDVRVNVGVDGVESETIHAETYTPTQTARGVQIFVPGTTYDHRYFDTEQGDSVESQARDAAEEGWVAIALDRLGTGESSKPAAASVTTAVHVASIDQFVDDVDREYDQLPIVLVGHSYGSVVAAGVAAESDTVDALVVTGFMYRQTPPSFEGFPELVAAATDPVLRGEDSLPEDYLTTAPGSRSFFYYAPNADQEVIDEDEQTKQTTTAAEGPGFGAEFETGAFASKVRVPVLVVVGEFDYLYAGNDPAAFEPDQKRTFGLAPSVDAVLVEDAAHVLALQRNAAETSALINRWAATHIS